MTKPGDLPTLEWYLPTRDGKCRLYVREVGEGLPVIVLHGGFGHDHGYLVPAFEGLDPEYRFVFYDQRGSLRSRAPLESISFDRHLEDLDQLREELGLDAMTLVGHSMGTLLASGYKTRYPERVRDLVLLGPVPPRTPPTPEEEALHAEQRQAFDAWLVRPEISRQIAKEGLDKEPLNARESSLKERIQFGGKVLVHVERWREVRGGGALYNEAAGRATEASIPKPYDFVPDLARHPREITAIMGDQEYQDLGCRLIRRVLGELANVRLEIVAEAGHCPWVDQPEGFRKALESALVAAAS